VIPPPGSSLFADVRCVSVPDPRVVRAGVLVAESNRFVLTWLDWDGLAGVPLEHPLLSSVHQHDLEDSSLGAAGEALGVAS